MSAAQALGRIAEKDAEVVKPAVPRLIKLLEDEYEDVRLMAAAALEGIATEDAEVLKPAVPRLIKLLEVCIILVGRHAS